jgi:alpha-L-arabinofuranosidase
VLFANHLGTEVVPATLSNVGPRVYTSVTRDDKLRRLFIKIVNANSDAPAVKIALSGAQIAAQDAKLTTLSGKTPNATNSIANPNVVVPVEGTVKIGGPNFDLTLAPYSINVLEVNY